MSIEDTPIESICEKWLKENGYNGLANPGIECGCALCDLMPCGNPQTDCVAGHKVLQADGDWKIIAGKEA